MSEAFVTAISAVIVALFGIGGVWLTARASRSVSRDQRMDKARQLDREAFQANLDAMNKRLGVVEKLAERQQAEITRGRRLLTLAVDHMRELRAALRMSGQAAPTLPQELADVWFEFTNEGDTDDH